MTIILVLLTLAIFLTIDYFASRKQVEATVAAKPRTAKIPRMLAPVIAGFHVPVNLRYHPGHTWAASDAPEMVRVGMDEFAAKLLGKVERATLPARGTWLRQGQKMMTLFRDGQSTELLSPIEGTVTDVNEAALANLEAARQDPYGEGWLLRVQSPDAKTSFRNLLSGTLARSWMEDAGRQLRAAIPSMSPALAQDGGLAVDDLTAEMPNPNWAEVTRQFFLN